MDFNTSISYIRSKYIAKCSEYIYVDAKNRSRPRQLKAWSHNYLTQRPTVADDMLLVSFSVQGLNAMLNICDKYSKQWQYQYNPSKCAVVVFNERTNGASNRMFKLGDHTIKEASS